MFIEDIQYIDDTYLYICTYGWLTSLGSGLFADQARGG